MEIKLTLSGAKELEATFRRAPGMASAEYRKALEAIAQKVVRDAKHKAPVNKKGGGGNLRQSIKYMQYGATGYIVWVNAQYGVHVDQGTRPHVIVPRIKPFLVFKNRSGNWMRTKRVNHPGQKPTFFFTNAVKDAEKFANTEMSSAMDRVLKRL